MFFRNKFIPVTALIVGASVNALELEPVSILGKAPRKHLGANAEMTLNPEPGKAIEEVLKLQPGLHLHRVGASEDVNMNGLSEDNIAVTVGGCRIFGACSGRMDPALSKVPQHRVSEVKVISGPFDVSHFGIFGGILDFDDSAAAYEEGLLLESGISSFDSYMGRFEATLMSDRELFRLGGGKEVLGMPETGSGALFSSFSPRPYKDSEEDFSRKTDFFLQYELQETENSRIRLKTQYDKREQALFPGKMMDSLNDVNRMVELGVTKNLSGGRDLDLSWFHNSVEHFMDNFTLRNAPAAMQMLALANASQSGIRAVLSRQNDWEIGFESYQRTWDLSMAGGMYSLDASMHLMGIWAEKTVSRNEWSHKYGLRIDDVTSRDERPLIGNMRNMVHGRVDREQDETLFSAFLESRKDLSDQWDLILGVGSSERPIDPMEHGISRMDWVGNPHLVAPRLTEFRAGFENEVSDLRSSIVFFHKDIQDHVHPAIRTLPSGARVRTYENIDARIQGVQVGARKSLSSGWEVGAHVAWQDGEKKELPTGINDWDLAEVPELTGRVEISKTVEEHRISLWGELAKDHTDVDTASGEVPLAGYAIWNLSYSRDLSEDMTVSLDVHNLLDKDAIRFNSYDRDPVNRVVRAIPEQGRTVWLKVTRKF